MKHIANTKKSAGRGRQKRKKDVRKLAAVYIAVVLAAAGAAGCGLFWALEGGRTQEVAQVESTETESVPEETVSLEETFEEATETESETEPEEEYVELTEDNIGNFVKVESCEIEPGSGSFVLKASAEGKPASDDDNLYLLEMNMYDTGVSQGAG